MKIVLILHHEILKKQKELQLHEDFEVTEELLNDVKSLSVSFYF